MESAERTAQNPAETLAVHPTLVSSLRCPACRSTLSPAGRTLVCSGEACHRAYPVVAHGVPVLIREEASLFDLADYTESKDTYFDSHGAGERRLLRRLVPGVSNNVKAKKNYQLVERLLLQRGSGGEPPSVLVLGGSIVGSGMEEFLASPRLRFVETDIAVSRRVAMVCDGHDLPFADGTFDAVVAQAVLEHVLDPFRCVDEMHRVLKPGGLVYAETAFMQGVHGGRYDFMRFTHLGHRRLFRRFEEVESGASCGPGMALGWSYRYFWRSLATTRLGRAAAQLWSGYTGFFWKAFDHLLIDRPRALDNASAVYFLGTRSETTLGDRDLIRLYREGN